VTGNVLPDDVNLFYAAGADLVLPKPLQKMQLDAVLEFIREKGFDSVRGQKLTMQKLSKSKYTLCVSS
jgi:hypothetical protein